LINEIAIDKQDLFIWNSSWDQNYYKYYNSTSDFIDVQGTKEMKEIKSVLGSKAMKIPEQFDLFEYTTKQITTTKKNITDTELAIELDKAGVELAFYENETSTIAVLQIDVYKRLLREMMGTSTDLRAKEEFVKIMNLVPGTFTSTDIDKKVEDYLKANILDLYEISEAKLFVKQTGNSADGKIETLVEPILEISARPLIETVPVATLGDVTYSEQGLINKLYTKNKDTKIVSQGNLKFQIVFSMDTRFYTSLSVGVTVKRI
jgi:hypothetical protein